MLDGNLLYLTCTMVCIFRSTGCELELMFDTHVYNLKTI